MWNVPTPEELAVIPCLYGTEIIPARYKIMYMHFFMGGHDWYVAEFDGDDTFFGFVILSGNYMNAEWGYFTFSDLRATKVGFMEVDRDLFWDPVAAIRIANICHAQGWQYEKDHSS